MQLNRTYSLRPMMIAVVCCCTAIAAIAQAESKQGPVSQDFCKQPKNVREAIMEEAERDQFTVRRIEFLGNTYTRDRDIHKGLGQIKEGDIFSRKNLRASVKRLSKMTGFYSITMANVDIRPDRATKDLDFIFCVKQKPKR